jgi:DNA-binding PadR family transcriptional regulator
LAALSPLGYALLCALHRGPLTGYDLVLKMRRPIGYYWAAQQSQIYPELARLEEAGLIAHSAEDGPGPRQRKTHRLTDRGRDALAAWLVTPPAVRPPRDEAALKAFAQSVADPAALAAVYAAEADRHRGLLEELRAQHANLLAAGGDDPGHPEFGAFATLELGLTTYTGREKWCRWLAAKLAERAGRA